MTDRTPAVRASDAEREQAVARLREATVEGRLTLDEFSQRMELAYAAKTQDDLERVTSDLPAQAAPAPATRRRASRFTVSVFSGFDRKGRWHVARKHWVFSIFGGSDLDFRDASLEGGEVSPQPPRGSATSFGALRAPLSATASAGGCVGCANPSVMLLGRIRGSVRRVGTAVELVRRMRSDGA